MNWSDFFLYISIIYFVYYIFNFLIDFSKSEKVVFSGNANELHFSDNSEPTVVREDSFAEEEDQPAAVWGRNDNDTEVITLIQENINNSTGGVINMAEIFSLAQSQAIQVKKAIVF